MMLGLFIAAVAAYLSAKLWDFRTTLRGEARGYFEGNAALDRARDGRLDRATFWAWAIVRVAIAAAFYLAASEYQWAHAGWAGTLAWYTFAAARAAHRNNRVLKGGR